MMMNSDLMLGYDYDIWYGYGLKQPLITDISTKTNSQTILCGMSGSGKSYAANILFAKICNASDSQGKVYFADFKQDDQFSYLQECPRYYSYNSSIEALEIVYDILHKRQSGEDKSRNPVTLIWDEYMANILAIQSIDKKKADEVMRKVSEILMLGRSLAVRLVISCQRPDASAFPSGSRLNYGIVLIVGAPIKSIYEMLIPKEYIDTIGDREFGVGEGVVLLQGSRLGFIKIPMVRDIEKMKQICIEALTR
ncbi:MAG: FtsK/SpoIIIE family protein [Eubacterium sp.]|jgi:adenylate kinase family enzyme|nr:FtsK/SpoIIIE family protein [Eubacterium sp.]